MRLSAQKYTILFYNILAAVLMVLSAFNAYSQELFPSTEPASTLPKKTISVRFGATSYQEPLGRAKYSTMLRAMYGATKKITVMMSAGGSNHHLKQFPGSLIQYFRLHHTRQYPAFPFLFDGVHAYVKWRIISQDMDKRHFRVALYGEGSRSFNVHDVAEPNLLEDNSGWGGGVITTMLLNRWAVSFTGGFVQPSRYKDSVAAMDYGRALMYNLSLGYRLFPVKYNSYQDVNINFYLEFLGKSYREASLAFRGNDFPIQYFLPEDPLTYNSLKNNSYVEVRPALQCIFNSSTRVDVGVALRVSSRSYAYYYPLFFINIQKYFFSH